MKLVKVDQIFYDLIKQNHLDDEILFNECGRPCVLLINLEYRHKSRKFVVPLRSNISPKTPPDQYFPLPPNKNTRSKCFHGVHYIKLFPIEIKYIHKYRKDDKYYELIDKILADNEEKIVSACQNYLYQIENGNKHYMTPDIDGILKFLEESNAPSDFT